MISNDYANLADVVAGYANRLEPIMPSVAKHIAANLLDLGLLINMVEHPRKRLGRPRKPDVQVVHDATTPALFTHNDDDNGGSAA